MKKRYIVDSAFETILQTMNTSFDGPDMSLYLALVETLVMNVTMKDDDFHRKACEYLELGVYESNQVSLAQLYQELKRVKPPEFTNREAIIKGLEKAQKRWEALCAAEEE
jgi:hypothetical protein